MTIFAKRATAGTAFVPAAGPSYESKNPGKVRANAVTFSPDGRLLVLLTRRTEPEIYWGKGELSLFAVGEGGVLVSQREIAQDEHVAVAFSPDGSLLAAAGSRSCAMVSLFSVGRDGAVSEVGGSPFDTGGAYAGSIAFSPDGRLLAAGNGSGGGDAAAVSVFSIGGDRRLTEVPGSPIANGPPHAKAPAPAFSPDGRLLAVADRRDGTVSVLAVGTDGALTPVDGSPFAVGSEPGAPAFSPDGTLLAVAGSEDGIVTVCAVGPDGALTAVADSPVPAPAGAETVGFSPTGRLLAVAGANQMSVFGIGSDRALAPGPGAPLRSYSQPVFSPDGSRLAVATGPWALSVMAVGADHALSPLPGSPFATGSHPASPAFSPDGTLLAVANNGERSVSVLVAA